MSDPEQTEETLDITTRDGAILILRQIREDIRVINLQGFVLLPTDHQLGALLTLCEQQTAQIFALATMLSGILGDPLTVAEVSMDRGAPDAQA